VLGIELNEYAAELARVTVWIGELQWMHPANGYAFKTHPVLEPLDHIECRDALMTPQGEEAAWPAVDVLVGNPPFPGRQEDARRTRRRVRRAAAPALPGPRAGRRGPGVLLVREGARAIEAGRLQRAGLVSTNSIRGGRNREVLDRICTSTRIFEAWSDEPWVNDGAAVRVSLVGFGQMPTAEDVTARWQQTIFGLLILVGRRCRRKSAALYEAPFGHALDNECQAELAPKSHTEASRTVAEFLVAI
jgi:hypothetical protein